MLIKSHNYDLKIEIMMTFMIKKNVKKKNQLDISFFFSRQHWASIH